MSAMGRMSYGVHMLIYPTFLSAYVFGYQPWAAEKAKKVLAQDFEDLSKARAVDPDLFSPFTPIPYHNNPELKYMYANIKMKDYVNENHINVTDYVWKGFHNSFDHDNKKTYMYNWLPK